MNTRDSVPSERCLTLSRLVLAVWLGCSTTTWATPNVIGWNDSRQTVYGFGICEAFHQARHIMEYPKPARTEILELLFSTKRLFAFGNFSRFVRPGYVRLVCAPSPAPGASVTAFRGGDKGPLVVVAINSGEAAQDIEYRQEGRQVKSFTPYRTSALASLARLGDVKLNQGTLKVSLSAQGATSFVASEVKSIPSAC